ncbi:MAG: GNAT family N-acetyltransferase [Nanoarchaeota archaeon]
MIRKATEVDFSSIYDLHVEMIQKLLTLNPKRFELKKNERETFKSYFAEYLKDPRKCIYVSERDGLVIGYGSARIERSVSFEKYPEHGWVSEVSVREDFQNRGIGGELMDAILAFFKSHNLVATYFLVETNNLQSIRAWEKKGFVKELVCFHKEMS